MKKLHLFLFLFVSINLYAQQKVTLPDGSKIIVYPDKTWKYEVEVQQSYNNQNGIVLNLASYATIHKHPSKESLELKSFTKYGVELIGYSNEFFKVKSNSGQIGYTRYIDYKNEAKYKLIFENKAVQKAKSEGKNILIKGISVTNINSANGVDFSIDWGYFDQSKDIKYIYFTVVPYNKVGDIQTCSIVGHSTFTGKITGPISAEDKFNQPGWGTAWYNSTISCIILTKVEVKYTDGSSYIYVNELPKIMDSDYSNNCN